MARALRWFLLALILTVPTAASAQEAAGTVSRVKGDARAAVGSVARRLEVGDPVFAGDRIATGSETRVEIRMIDGAVITLGDGSEFTIGEFEPEERGRVFGLLRGVFLAVSGKLASGRTSPMTVQTQIAQIGVRGTTVWGVQSPEKLQVVLLDGRIFVESIGRRVDLTEPLTATVVVPGAAPTAPVPVSPEALEAAKKTVAFE